MTQEMAQYEWFKELEKRVSAIEKGALIQQDKLLQIQQAIENAMECLSGIAHTGGAEYEELKIALENVRKLREGIPTRGDA